MTSIFEKLCDKNKFILVLLNEDGTTTKENVKSINEISKKTGIPYSTLINIYYVCINKGGGKDKSLKKRYIQPKYKELLKYIRIFDTINEHMMDNTEYFDNLLLNIKELNKN